VYLLAFLVFVFQGPALIGHDGLLPSGRLPRSGARRQRLELERLLDSALPVLARGLSDHAMAVVGLAGVAISALAVLGFSNALSWLVLWALYNVGGARGAGRSGASAGENQLLETGVLAAFFCPLLDPRPLPDRAPPIQVVWLFRLADLRIMLGSALIKLRGDPCWARPELPRLPLRDAADPQPADAAVPLPCRIGSTRSACSSTSSPSSSRRSSCSGRSTRAASLG